MTLNIFSLEELKKIGKTDIKYIDRTIQCQIRKIEKIAYKELVINNDSDNDNEDITDEETVSLSNIKIKKTLSKNKRIVRKTSLQNLPTIININSIEETQEKKLNNVQKTKINVVDNFTTFNTPQNPKNNINIHNLKKKYIQRKISQKINSWNYIDLNNYQHLSNNSLETNNNLQAISLNADPMATSEHICIKLFLFLSNVKIENYNEKNWDINFFRNLAHSEEFNELKDLILSLKNISIDNLSEVPKNYYCFWLNMYNFLTIFSVIYKCEIISNYYEWYRFLKNSYFTIGDVEISLYEIESNILRDKSILDNIYGKIKYNNNKLKLPNVKKFDKLINFGISLPTISSPCLRMYFPMNFLESLKFNAYDYFSKNLGIDLQNKTIQIPEFINWIDSSFIENINNYKDFMPKDLIHYIKKNQMQLNIIIEKFDWKLSFVNFKNNELYI